MAKYAVIKSFYGSEKWQKFRACIIAERGPVCEHCGKVIANLLDCEVHHKKELTPENVHDASISLSPDNVEILCHCCHDKEHHRFGHSEHGVSIVYGPPFAGKTTYVRQHMQRGDIVVDMDKLFAAVSLLPEYDKPDVLLQNVLGLRNLLIDNIKTRYGKWHSAWIIGGYEDKYRREQLATETGAELIFCDVSKEECLRRLEADETRRCRKDDYAKYINRWFDRYVA